MANDPYSILWRGRDASLGFEVSKQKAKVTRYYAGQAPTWAKEAEEEEEEEQRILIKDEHAQRRLQPRHITLSEARCRLDRGRFSRPNTHF